MKIEINHLIQFFSLFATLVGVSLTIKSSLRKNAVENQIFRLDLEKRLSLHEKNLSLIEEKLNSQDKIIKYKLDEIFTRLNQISKSYHYSNKKLNKVS